MLFILSLKFITKPWLSFPMENIPKCIGNNKEQQKWMHDIYAFSKYVKQIYIPSKLVNCYSPLSILFNYNANFFF